MPAQDATVFAPRKNVLNPADTGVVSGHDFVKLGRNTSLVFTFPGMPSNFPKKLIIRHANEITWSYSLNTSVQSTYGGEVIQVLSCNVGPISLSGQTHDHFDGKTFVSGNDELRHIYEWFRTAMTVMGGAGKSVVRNEVAIHMSYPERGWSFYFHPTALKGFAYGTQRLAQPWTIQGEVMDDNDLNYFQKQTMAAFNEGFPELPNFGEVGFKNRRKFSDPNFQTATPVDLATLGENFQSLLGAWSAGEYNTWGFDQQNTPEGNNLKAATDYFTAIFGSNVLVDNAGGGSSVIIGSGGATATKYDLVKLIAGSWEALSMPGEIGVAVAMVESNLNPNARQPNGDHAMGLFQTFPTGAGGNYHKAALQAALDNPNDPVTKYYDAGTQITDASQWFALARSKYYPNSALADDETKAAFAKSAQQAGDPNYVSKVLQALPEARALIKTAKKASVNGSALAQSALTLAKQEIGYAEGPNNDNKYGQAYGMNHVAWCAIFCSIIIRAAGGGFRYSYVPAVLSDAQAGRNGLTTTTTPAPGDLVVFDWNGGAPDHLGFFDSWIEQGSSFRTVEGNTSPDTWGPQSNGGGVYDKVRYMTNVKAFVKYSS